MQIGLRFAGVVKTGSRRYSLWHFNQEDMFEKGDSISLTSDIIDNGESKKVVAVCWRGRHCPH